jgi:hypothetical protein
MCVRDPRDIVASFIRIGERQVRLRQETRYSRREISFICKKINASYQTILNDDMPAGVTLVRYEDVVTDPASTLRHLADETGLPLEPAQLDSLTWLEGESRHQEAWQTELEGNPPTPRNVGAFRQLLSLKEKAQVQESCGPLIRKFRYMSEADGRATPTP